MQPFLCALIRPHLISALVSPDFRFSLAILLLTGSLQRDTRTWLSSCPCGMEEGMGLSLLISAASLFAPLSFLLSCVRGACGPAGCWGEWRPSSVGQLPSEVCPVSCLLRQLFQALCLCWLLFSLCSPSCAVTTFSRTLGSTSGHFPALLPFGRP